MATHCPPIATLEGFTRAFHVVGRTSGQRESDTLRDVVATRLLASLEKDDDARLLVAWDGDDAKRPDSFITVFLTTVDELIPAPLLARVTFVYFLSPLSPWPKEEAPAMSERLCHMLDIKSVVASRIAATDSLAARLWREIQDVKEEVNRGTTDVASAIRGEESFGLTDGTALIEGEGGRLTQAQHGNAGYCLLALAVSRLLRGAMGEFTTIAITGGERAKVTDLERAHGDATEWVDV